MLDLVDTRNITILKSGLVQNLNKLPKDDNQNVNNCYRDVWVPLNNKKIKCTAFDVPNHAAAPEGACSGV